MSFKAWWSYNKRKQPENISQEVFTWDPSWCSGIVRVKKKENRKKKSHELKKKNTSDTRLPAWLNFHFINRSGDLSCHHSCIKYRFLFYECVFERRQLGLRMRTRRRSFLLSFRCRPQSNVVFTLFCLLRFLPPETSDEHMNPTYATNPVNSCCWCSS